MLHTVNAHVQPAVEFTKAESVNSEQADWANVPDSPETLGDVCLLIICKISNLFCFFQYPRM